MMGGGRYGPYSCCLLTYQCQQCWPVVVFVLIVLLVGRVRQIQTLKLTRHYRAAKHRASHRQIWILDGDISIVLV